MLEHRSTSFPYKLLTKQTLDPPSWAASLHRSETLGETNLIHRACPKRRLAHPRLEMPAVLNYQPRYARAYKTQLLTFRMTFRLPHTSPVAFGFAPLHRAIIAAKSLICESIGSRRLSDVDGLLLRETKGSRAFVCLRRSSTLSTSRIHSPSSPSSERNRSKALDRSKLWIGELRLHWM